MKNEMRSMTKEPPIVRSVAQSDGLQIVQLEWAMPLNKTEFLVAEMDVGAVINLIFELQKSIAWFHPLLTEEQHRRIREALAVTEEVPCQK